MARATLPQYAAYLLLRGAVAALRLLPTRLALLGARGLARLGWWCDRRHRRVALDNVSRVFGKDRSDPEVRRIARAGFEHLALVTVEFMLLGRLFKSDRPERCLRTRRREVLDEAAAGGKGIVFVCGHAGNWEVMGALMGRLGYPLHIVSRPIQNPLLQEWARQYRTSFGEVLVPKDGALRDVARLLHQGRHVVFMMDQHAGSGGLQVDFLGWPASTFASAAAMARKFDLAIVTGHAARTERPMEFLVEFELVARPDPLLDKDADILRMTQAINDAMGRFIRTYPEQWLWLHRRWRPVPGAGCEAPAIEATHKGQDLE
ncbi:MAG: lysophospholipid acyltransferase family protein [Planctomycetota bacterium]